MSLRRIKKIKQNKKSSILLIKLLLGLNGWGINTIEEKPHLPTWKGKGTNDSMVMVKKRLQRKGEFGFLICRKWQRKGRKRRGRSAY